MPTVRSSLILGAALLAAANLPLQAQAASRCTSTATSISCSAQTAWIDSGSAGQRKVVFQVPTGSAPSAGWPVALLFHGSLVRVSGFTYASDAPFGGYHQGELVRALLDSGYAVIAPNALTAAESLGLGGVYIGGLRNSIEAVTELLELPQHVLPLFGLCLGWPADNPDIKPRMPAAMLVHENRYQPLDNALLAEYDEQLAHYYLSRGSNARRDTWSDHIRRTIVKESRPFILDYLHKQGWATR